MSGLPGVQMHRDEGEGAPRCAPMLKEQLGEGVAVLAAAHRHQHSVSGLDELPAGDAVAQAAMQSAD